MMLLEILATQIPAKLRKEAAQLYAAGAVKWIDRIPPALSAEVETGSFIYTVRLRENEVTKPPGKTRIKIRIDDILLGFERRSTPPGGGSCQALINQALGCDPILTAAAAPAGPVWKIPDGFLGMSR